MWRIDRRGTFEALRRGCRFRDGPLTVSWVPGDSNEPPRVACSVGRRVGTAVARNRVRRRLRMLMREQSPNLRSGAYLIAVGPAAATLPYAALGRCLRRALAGLERIS